MTTAIDTNILVTLWDEDDRLHVPVRQALELAFERGKLVVAGAVYAELLAAPGRTEEFLDRFCEETGIGVEWALPEKVWRAAGLAFQGYAARRKRQKGTEPRRILTDFLVGAHATVNGYKLLTLDAGLYRVSFPRLELVEA
jgi:predicted nucleic acid-binding protein